MARQDFINLVKQGKKSGKYTRNLPLYGADFGYVFVDEVGMLTNTDTHIFDAVKSIQCRRRVGATGTPLQNDYYNLRSLCQFLGLKPWSNGDIFDKVGSPQESCPGFVPAY